MSCGEPASRTVKGASGVGEQALREGAAQHRQHRVEQVLRAGEHDLGQVEGGDQGGQGDPEAFAAGVDDCTVRATRGVDGGTQARDGQPGLEAAALAAGAVLAAVGDDAAGDTATNVDEHYVPAGR